MLKIYKIKSLLSCEQCNQLLVDPISIPCGFSICKINLDKLLENSIEENKFQCILFHKQHIITIGGFVINERIQNILDSGSNKFKPSRVYEVCTKGINDVKDNAAQIEA
jgi:hypothetical protein